MGLVGAADYHRQPGLMGSTGSSGWICYWSTGSLITGKGFAPAGLCAGVLDKPNVAGSYGVVVTDAVVEMVKGNGTQPKIEAGQILYGSAANAIATAQVNTGSAIGVAWEQSSTDKSTVLVHIMANNPGVHV